MMSVLSSFRSHAWTEPMGRTKSRISAWFHGQSVVGNERPRPSQRATKTSRSTDLYAFPKIGTDNRAASGLRSPSSTRSMIDPSSSPCVASGPAYPSVFHCMRQEERRQPEVTRYDEDDILGIGRNPRTRTRLALIRPRSKRRSRKPSRGCSPSSQKYKLRSESVGCLISGGLLISTLTTCKSELSGSEIFGQLISFRPRTYSI